jgi:predicted transposase/invertase (TIGR01784 family)
MSLALHENVENGQLSSHFMEYYGMTIGHTKTFEEMLRDKGIEIGKEQVILEMAKAMLENGITIELIAKVTKLKKKQILALKTKA